MCMVKFLASVLCECSLTESRPAIGGGGGVGG